MRNEYLRELLKLLAKYDATHIISWDEDLNFYFTINSGGADAEDIYEEDIELLEQCLIDCKKLSPSQVNFAGILFSERKRGVNSRRS